LFITEKKKFNFNESIVKREIIKPSHNREVWYIVEGYIYHISTTFYQVKIYWKLKIMSETH